MGDDYPTLFRALGQMSLRLFLIPTVSLSQSELASLNTVVVPSYTGEDGNHQLAEEVTEDKLRRVRRKGEHLFLHIASANMNEDTFPSPHILNAARTPHECYLQNDGCFKVLGDKLASTILAEVLWAVALLENVHQGPGQSGKLMQFLDAAIPKFQASLTGCFFDDTQSSTVRDAHTLSPAHNPRSPRPSLSAIPRVFLHDFHYSSIPLTPIPMEKPNFGNTQGAPSSLMILLSSKLLQYQTRRYFFLLICFLSPWFNDFCSGIICCSTAMATAANAVAWPGLVIAISAHHHTRSRY
ncbi:hypothetical protein C8R48DRAFT_778224 [Suillus tomentosus]|nr:hypothetical protein C8R48DRAFT_778224 [Suillus tomentosus]